ncbi:hypothetical protein ABIE27_004128 [Paenibacillus sp. 4624]
MVHNTSKQANAERLCLGLFVLATSWNGLIS